MVYTYFLIFSYMPFRIKKSSDAIILLRWNNTNLDDSQKDGVRFALKQRELAIIHGPPGLQSSLHPSIRIFFKVFTSFVFPLSSKRFVFKKFKVQLVTYFNNRFLFLTVKEGTRENILTLSCWPGVSKILYQTGDMHKFLQIFSCNRG